MEFHKPVLLDEAINGLNIKENGVYIDLTYGGGGHSRAILNRLKNGKLIAFDQDEDVLNELINDKRFDFYLTNFRFFHRFVKYAGYQFVDGILADLGVSAYQISTASRGFSYKFDSELDMRMNKYAEKNALDVLNTYEEGDLKRILKEFGEVEGAGKIAKAIVSGRAERKITSVNQFVEILTEFLPVNKQYKTLSKIFQAIRIEVNDEIDVLKDMLKNGLKLLKPGGRFVVISYHSVEDKYVKSFFKTGCFDRNIQSDMDIYGNVKSELKLISKKAIVPDENEIRINKSARSAKLRIAEKI
ncbi:MAG: 16S rRNA (cytosine(1402)-N(4))-methyltransferase RsmH [Marinilabiliales bacterium]